MFVLLSLLLVLLLMCVAPPGLQVACTLSHKNSSSPLLHHWLLELHQERILHSHSRNKPDFHPAFTHLILLLPSHPHQLTFSLNLVGVVHPEVGSLDTSPLLLSSLHLSLLLRQSPQLLCQPLQTTA